MEASDLADMLRALKERSGLSYGVLAKRLHVSTSTLHRYCSGSTVPAEFAPVERLARLCKATPEELMQVHRLWIIADATRGRKAQADGEPADAPRSGAAAPAEEAEAEESEEAEGKAPAPVAAPLPSPPLSLPSAGAKPAGRPQRERRPRKAVLAALAVVCVMGSAALAVGLVNSGADDDGTKRSAAASSPDRPEAAAPGKPGRHPSGTPSSSASQEGKGQERDEPTASAGPGGTASPLTSGKQDSGDGKREGKAGAEGATRR
ncbi:helix-turn-helix domain-containing protein [Streptomyces stramineus]